MLQHTETDRCDEFVKTYSRKFVFQINNFREKLERKLAVKTLLENHQNHFKELQKLLNIDPGGHLPAKSRLELAMDVDAIVSNDVVPKAIDFHIVYNESLMMSSGFNNVASSVDLDDEQMDDIALSVDVPMESGQGRNMEPGQPQQVQERIETVPKPMTAAIDSLTPAAILDFISKSNSYQCKLLCINC